MNKNWNNKKAMLILGLLVLVLVLIGVLFKCTKKEDAKPADEFGKEVYVKEDVDEEDLDIKDAKDAETDNESKIDYNSFVAEDKSDGSKDDTSGTANDNGSTTKPDDESDDSQKKNPNEEQPNENKDIGSGFGAFF